MQYISSRLKHTEQTSCRRLVCRDPTRDSRKLHDTGLAVLEPLACVCVCVAYSLFPYDIVSEHACRAHTLTHTHIHTHALVSNIRVHIMCGYSYSNATSMLQWTGYENICQRHFNSRGRPRIFHVARRTAAWEAHRSSPVRPSVRLRPPRLLCMLYSSLPPGVNERLYAPRARVCVIYIHVKYRRAGFFFVSRRLFIT